MCCFHFSGQFLTKMNAAYFISMLLTTYMFKMPKSQSTQIQIFTSLGKINQCHIELVLYFATLRFLVSRLIILTFLR
jgi:hypothetical protein